MEVIDPCAVMDSAVQRHPIAIRHAVFRDDDRKFIALCNELRSPMQDLRRHLPQKKGVSMTRSKLGMDRVSMRSGFRRNARVGIEAIEIQRLTHSFQVGGRELWHGVAEGLEAVLRIKAKNNRIRIPARIPSV